NCDERLIRPLLETLSLSLLPSLPVTRPDHGCAGSWSRVSRETKQQVRCLRLLHRHGDSSCFRDSARGSGYGDDVGSSSCAGYEESGTSYFTPAPAVTCDRATSQ